jgi:Flp pilus assembly protein TadB
METQAINYLDSQHCLSIAAAFIAVIAACASLISGANSKAESLTKRIHEAADEFRGSREGEDDRRRRQIQRQLDYYDERFRKVQTAQGLLFSTISIFIACLAVFISIALYAVYYRIPDVTVYPFAGYLLIGIGGGVAVGTLLMLCAIYLHFREVRLSYKTLSIEMSDCQKADVATTAATQPRPDVSAPASEMIGSRG